MRPKDWDETKWKTIPYNAPLISGEQVAKVYEAGADAILAALRKKTIFYVFGNGDNSSGNIVFIPDGEQI